MLHEVLPDSTANLPPYAITRATLRAILADFTARGYTSGTLDDVITPIHGPGAPRRRLVLTFDDGTADFLEHALPVLQEFQFAATLFIVAGLVGGRRSWRNPDGTMLEPVPLMTAADLRGLAGRGFAIGSHTMSHAALPALTPTAAAAEIARSRNVLSDLLGQAVDWFAYPYVQADASTRALVRGAGYRGAVGGGNQRHERYYLNRIEAAVFTLPQLRLRCNGLFQFTRHTYRQVRYGL